MSPHNCWNKRDDRIRRRYTPKGGKDQNYQQHRLSQEEQSSSFEFFGTRRRTRSVNAQLNKMNLIAGENPVRDPQRDAEELRAVVVLDRSYLDLAGGRSRTCWEKTTRSGLTKQRSINEGFPQLGKPRRNEPRGSSRLRSVLSGFKPLNHSVAFAGSVFQSAAVYYLHRATFVLDETGLLQNSSGNADARASCT